ncbi:DNA-3-methyladenine glycosylase isoform X2 [Agrilus planipennis]|uniref:DNA-3-methyladenine glycosylase n=1 Tax=Agrilus planipennis TaxID=224129 RepID=A0A1W4X7B5_AGRPL|nr:DNA-3-methyladenine glycosylase isoform X2 [Agrilus planipennis]
MASDAEFSLTDKSKNTEETLTNRIIKLGRNFFDIPCYNLAVYLLGKILVRKLEDGTLLKARIVETECYLGGDDKASNSYNGRKTPGNEPMYMKAGTAYVYMTYGMYFCMNISSTEPGAAVLLRALDPIKGFEKMNELRAANRKTKRNSTSSIISQFDIKDLCNGPSKLCMTFGITKDLFNKVDICDSELLWVEDDLSFNDEFKVVKTSRIGIESAGIEWSKKPLRFYILGNKSKLKCRK